MPLRLHPPLTPETERLLARAMFPDPRRQRRALARYRDDPTLELFAWTDDDPECGRLVSALGLRRGEHGAELLHLGTDPDCTGQGYGRALVLAVAAHLTLPLSAETDDDSVGFYRRCGFGVQAAPSAWGTPRYRCMLTRHTLA